MNTSKILYWNNLRSLVNKWVLIFSGITLLITLLLPKRGLFKSSLIHFDFSSIIISTFVNLLVYIAIINFILIILEFLDRMTNLKERKIIKKYFKYMILTIFLLLPILEMVFRLL